MTNPIVTPFFHTPSGTFTYLVHAPDGKEALIIDPVLDFDPASARISSETVDAILAYVEDQDLSLVWALETHIHADHVSAAHYLRNKLGVSIGAGDHIPAIQSTFSAAYNLPYPFATDGSQFTHLFNSGETLEAAGLAVQVLSTPGHTPACVSYLIGDAIFVGDTLFRPDFGTARCDFPGGDAKTLYSSIETILALPDETRVFLCHDYPADGQAPISETSVGEQKALNVHVAGKSRDEFVHLREERDAGLALPDLLLPSIQLNMRAGELPPAEENGVAYLKVPLNYF